MLIEIGGTILTYNIGKSLIKYLNNADTRQLKFTFNNIMYSTGIKTKANETFEIYKADKMKYGYFAIIKIPNGLDYSKLESLKNTIQDNLKCMIEFDKDRYSNLVKTKLIYSPQDTKPFSPCKTQSHELFLGYLPDGKPYKLNLNKNPHILIAGKTGTGKSFEFASILTNLIYNNKKDIEVYLFQIMKGEIDIFKNCPSVKFASDNAEEILIILNKLYNKMHERSKQFSEYGIKNITQWNKHFPKKKMKRIIIGVEEISFFMGEHSDENKKEKNPYFDKFTGVVKAGRSVGIDIISITQRTTATNLGGNGELKSQMCVVTGQQKTRKDSENAIDIPDAVYLKEQECIANTNDGYTWFKSPTIDEDYNILQQYVPEILTPAKVIQEKQVKNKSKDPNEADNVLICENSIYMPLDEYNKLYSIDKLNTNKSNFTPLPISKKRKGVVKLNNLNKGDKIAN